MGGTSDPLVPLFRGSDSAVQLWEPDTQDAGSQALGGNACIFREEASTLQSVGGSLGAGPEAAEPTVLLPAVDPPPESTGEELLGLEEVGAPWIWKDYLPYKIMVKSKGFGFD